MKHSLFVLAVSMAFVWPGLAKACDDKGEKCQVEEWRSAHNEILEILVIEGVSTCDKGRIRIRVYDTSEDKPKFIGTSAGRIRNHTFRENITEFPKKPASMSIKFNVEHIE